MQIAAFSPVGVKTDVAATTAQTRTAMQVATSPTLSYNLRVVNEADDTALVAMGTVAVDATTDTGALAIPPGERIVAWPFGATHCSVALRSGSGTVQIQLGAGV